MQSEIEEDGGSRGMAESIPPFGGRWFARAMCRVARVRSVNAECVQFKPRVPLVSGPRSLVLVPLFVLGLCPGPWPLVPGSGSWALIPGSWFLVLVPGPCSLLLVTGPWSLVPGPWLLVPGPWSSGHGPWPLVPNPWPWPLPSPFLRPFPFPSPGLGLVSFRLWLWCCFRLVRLGGLAPGRVRWLAGGICGSLAFSPGVVFLHADWTRQEVGPLRCTEGRCGSNNLRIVVMMTERRPVEFVPFDREARATNSDRL